MNAASIFELRWHGDDFYWNGQPVPALDGFEFSSPTTAGLWDWGN